MYSISCRDLGGDCDHTVTGNSVEEVKEGLFAHAADAHPEKLKTMSEEEKKAMVQKMEEVLAAQA